MRCAIFTVIIIAVPSILLADTLIVPDHYPTIQAAILGAKDGDTVLVKPGTYIENIDFLGKAITVRSDGGPDVTHIDGNQAGSVVTCQSGEGADSILEGFSITNGHSICGGGMYIKDGSPTIAGCEFMGNSAEYGGGGMYILGEDGPTVLDCAFTGNSVFDSEITHGGGICNFSSRTVVEDCLFNQNTASGGHLGNYGGGMCNYNSNASVTNCVFSENEAHHGGGMYNGDQSAPKITGCMFIENVAKVQGYTSTGGGMCNYASSPTVTDCIFIENSAKDYPQCRGGGMYNYYNTPTVKNCEFTGNSAGWLGGGMFNDSSSLTVVDCKFSGNSAEWDGGGMYNDGSNLTIINGIISRNSARFDGGGMFNDDSALTIINCTITINSAEDGGGMFNDNSDPGVTNCILWRDTPNAIANKYSSPVLTHCCITGGHPGTGNIDSDPLFVDIANDDFHLTFPSPCKDTGDNSAVTEHTDFEGDLRIAYGTVDMGADEFYTHLYYTGDAIPGGDIALKFVDLPDTSPLFLCVGTGVLDDPIQTKWGKFWLPIPFIGPIHLGSIPSPGGLYILSVTLPPDIPGPYFIPMQARIGDVLTNLCVMEVD